MREPTYLELLAVVSRLRTCPDSCPACAAAAAATLGEDVPACARCGQPHLPDRGPCGCERYLDEPPNPAAAHFHLLTLAPPPS